MEQNKQSAPQNAASEAAVRRQKLADLKAAGHDPFTITKCKQDAFSADLKEEYKESIKFWITRLRKRRINWKKILMKK